METVTNANQQMTEANQEKIEDKTEVNVIDLEAKMKMALDEESRIKEANFILTQEF
jgi:hypothetical protein